MKTFKYGFFAKIIYRYANIPSNIILIIYLLASLLGIVNEWKFIFPMIITIILIYVLNRFYLRMYKTFPFNVQINNEKMICSDFVINNRNVVIKHSNIKEINGGIFSGRAYMPLYIKTENLKIGISPHIKDYSKLLTIILTNIPKELYDSLLDSINKIAHDNTPKSKSKSQV